MTGPMTAVLKSLAYDTVVLTVAIVVVVFTHGSVKAIAAIIGGVTTRKAPYDVWEARRSRTE